MKKYITDVHRWRLRRISSPGHLQKHEFKVSLGYKLILSQNTARYGGAYFSSSTWETEEGEPEIEASWSTGESQDSQCYIEKLNTKPTKQKKTSKNIFANNRAICIDFLIA